MALATPEDVATRLGRDLTAIEAGTVDFMLQRDRRSSSTPSTSPTRGPPPSTLSRPSCR
jgi:hypothetical protein